jgi:hypothetical protein
MMLDFVILELTLSSKHFLPFGVLSVFEGVRFYDAGVMAGSCWGRRVGVLELELGLLLWVWEGVAYGGMG